MGTTSWTTRTTRTSWTSRTTRTRWTSSSTTSWTTRTSRTSWTSWTPRTRRTTRTPSSTTTTMPTNLPNDLCSNMSTILLSSAQKKVETKFWDSVKARLICVYIITHLSSYLTSSFKRWKDIFIQDLVNI